MSLEAVRSSFCLLKRTCCLSNVTTAINSLSLFPWCRACPLKISMQSENPQRCEGQLGDPAPLPGKIPLACPILAPVSSALGNPCRFSSQDRRREDADCLLTTIMSHYYVPLGLAIPPSQNSRSRSEEDLTVDILMYLVCT